MALEPFGLAESGPRALNMEHVLYGEGQPSQCAMPRSCERDVVGAAKCAARVVGGSPISLGRSAHLARPVQDGGFSGYGSTTAFETVKHWRELCHCGFDTFAVQHHQVGRAAHFEAIIG